MPGPIHWLVSRAEALAEQLQNVLSLKATRGQNKEKNKDFVQPGGLMPSIIWELLDSHYLTLVKCSVFIPSFFI